MVAAGARGWSDWVFDPVYPASVACPRGYGPQPSVTLGQMTLGVIVPCSVFISRKSQNMSKPCNIHNKFPVYQKIKNDLSKCSEK
jgi:hypothetical protein